MKLYLAGPDVFLPDATKIGKIKQELCAKHGFAGLFPLDNEFMPDTRVTLSKAIFDGNVAMLEDADAVIANLTPFRGVSADVGTAFEVGYAFARGKPIFGYSNVKGDYLARVHQTIGKSVAMGEDGRPYAADGQAVENFGRFDNLMVAEALLANGSDVVKPEADVADVLRDMAAFERCLQIADAFLKRSRRVSAVR